MNIESFIKMHHYYAKQDKWNKPVVHMSEFNLKLLKSKNSPAAVSIPQ